MLGYILNTATLPGVTKDYINRYINKCTLKLINM